MFLDEPGSLRFLFPFIPFSLKGSSASRAAVKRSREVSGKRDSKPSITIDLDVWTT